MFCPQCGQQQVSGDLRFCSRCGFLLTVINDVVAHGGNLPAYQLQPTETITSPKRRGVRQGGMLFLSGIVLVPLLGVLYSWINAEIFGLAAGAAAIICFIGGVVRMLFAALFEEGAPAMTTMPATTIQPMMPSQIPPSYRQPQALPPRQSIPAADYRKPRVDTSELFKNPTSVTEGTTRLLDKEPDYSSGK
jgi:hypothetical protein